MELDNFIITFQEEKNRHAKAGELHSFIQSFAFKEDTGLKKNMIVNLISQMPELFAVLTNFENAANTLDATEYCDVKELKSSDLQAAILCLESLLMCINHTNTPEQLESLFHTTINVLVQSYTHCKESEALYGDLLEEFADQLAKLLNKIQVVQDAMLTEFDRIVTSNLSDAEAAALVNLSADLGNLCNLVSSLETTMAVKLWRMFIKIVSKYPELSRQKVKVDPIFSILVSEITSMVDEFKFKMENEELVEESEVKIFLFLTNLVMKLFHIFHSFANESFQSISTLTLKLSDLWILSYSPLISNEISHSKLKVAVRNTVKLIVPLFYCNSTFLNTVLQLDDKEFSTDLHIAHMLLKTSALSSLLSSKNYMKIEKNEDIFKNAMITFQLTKPQDDIQLTSVKIPRSLFPCTEGVEDDNKELVTIYQHAYIHFSEYSRIISDSDFEKIEGDILELLISCSEIVSLLVSDIWIYRLRCSSTEYLLNRIVNLLQSSSRFQSSLRYKHILERMLKFLPSDVLIRLFEENGKLKELIFKPNRVLHRYGIPQLICHQRSGESSKILKMISLLIHELKSPILEDTQLITKACCLLELFSLFVNIFQTADIVKFTELAKYMFKSEIYEVQIAVLTFLKAFNDKTFDEKAADFKKVVNVLATLLAETLQSRNYVVRFVAFHIYTSFSQSPSLVKVCRQTVVVAPNLAVNIKSYFSKVPLNGFLTEKERMKNLQNLLGCTKNQPEKVADIKKLLPLKSI